MLFVLVFAVLPSLSLTSASSQRGDVYDVFVGATEVVGHLDHFWRSTGFCPPDPHQDFFKFLSADDELQNIAYIGSVPQQGIRQVRIHWLLDLVTINEGNSLEWTFNFTYLDKAMDLIVSNGLQPGFELMGNPSNYFTDFDDTAQIHYWRDLVAAVGKHLILSYGLEEVSQWNFESWNEPQNVHHFDGLHVTVEGYLKYYDACSEGLKLAHPSLRLGGPATGLPDTHPIFWDLLEHCFNGTNFFTGEKGVRLDFISFHIKGQGHSSVILNEELSTLQEIASLFPNFTSIPVFNDEGDPLVGWSESEAWRADARYAAIVVKILAQHQNFFLSSNTTFRYTLLSNDNGFISYAPHYFSQRTLLARFQMNHSQPRRVEFIKKPVLSVMGLLALLGNQQIFSEVTSSGQKLPNDTDVGVIASISNPVEGGPLVDWELSLIMYNSNDTSNRTSLENVNLSIHDLPLRRDLRYALYKVDNINGNPYGVWKDMGSPVFPTDEQFQELRRHQEPVRVLGPSVLPDGSTSLAFSFDLPLPGVSLLHICAMPMWAPLEVAGITLHTVSPTDVLITWKDSFTRCVKTYEVLYSPGNPYGPYTRANQVDLIFTAFLHTHSKVDPRASLWYKVRAVDYWGRPGVSSSPSGIRSANDIRGESRKMDLTYSSIMKT